MINRSALLAKLGIRDRFAVGGHIGCVFGAWCQNIVFGIQKSFFGFLVVEPI